MAVASQFAQTVTETCKQFVYWMQQIEQLKSRMDSDPTLATDAPQSRPDLTKADYDALNAAIQQMDFTWNSGTPMTHAAFYKML